jgi:hypothetical protein
MQHFLHAAMPGSAHHRACHTPLRPAHQAQQGAVWCPSTARASTLPAQAMHAQQPRTAAVVHQVLCIELLRSRHSYTGLAAGKQASTPHGPAALAATASMPAQDSDTVPTQQGGRSSNYAACTNRPNKGAEILQHSSHSIHRWSGRYVTTLV